MKKQIDFAVHVATLGMNSATGAMSSEQFTQFIKSRGHFGDGWEVVGPAQFIQSTADGISVLITLVKYAEVDETAKMAEIAEEKAEVYEESVPRRGRPPKNAS